MMLVIEFALDSLRLGNLLRSSIVKRVQVVSPTATDVDAPNSSTSISMGSSDSFHGRSENISGCSCTLGASKAGTITYGGPCSSNTTVAVAGNNTITLNALANGTYENCTITVTDNSGNREKDE